MPDVFIVCTSCGAVQLPSAWTAGGGCLLVRSLHHPSSQAGNRQEERQRLVIAEVKQCQCMLPAQHI